MKKKLSLLIYITLPLLLFTACNKEEEPYDRYLAAREKLLQTESVTTEWKETVIETNNGYNPAGIENTSKINATNTLQFAKTKNGDTLVYESVMQVEDNATSEKINNQTISYFKDGILYQNDYNTPDQKFCFSQADDYAKRVLAQNVNNYPKSAIATQTSEITEDGELISIIFDSQKLYDYLYPDVGYGNYDTFKEPPTFSALIDREGNLIKTTGHFYTTMSNESGYTQTRDRNFTMTYSQYNKTVPDFSDFNPEDYQLYPN